MTRRRKKKRETAGEGLRSRCGGSGPRSRGADSGPAVFVPLGLPDSFVCSTPFPPDDRSYGWERGTTISKEWDEATTDAAIDTAEYVVAHLNDLAGTRDDASDRADEAAELLPHVRRAGIPPTADGGRKRIGRRSAIRSRPKTPRSP